MARYDKEIKKALLSLDAFGIECECIPLFDGYALKGVDANGEDWDVVCHSFSNGHENCLLEALGSVCEEPGCEEVMDAKELVRRLLNIEKLSVPTVEPEPYEAMVSVTGRFRTTVWASSVEEAKEKAEYIFEEADFGDLESVDGYVYYVEDDAGEQHFFK